MTVPGPAVAVSNVAVVESLVDSPNRHEPSLGSAHSLNPAVWVPSWDSTVPPVAVAFTHAETVTSVLVAIAGPDVDSAPLPPPPGVELRTTSGLYRSPVCHAASPVPVTGRAGEPVMSAAL